MHSTATHTTIGRVSRRGQREPQIARSLSSVSPCLHVEISRTDRER